MTFLLRLGFVFFGKKIKIFDDLSDFLTDFVHCQLLFVVKRGDFFNGSLKVKGKLIKRSLLNGLLVHLQTAFSSLDQLIFEFFQRGKRIDKKSTDFSPQLLEQLFFPHNVFQFNIFLFLDILMKYVVIIFEKVNIFIQGIDVHVNLIEIGLTA
jgi:hypothetical protein